MKKIIYILAAVLAFNSCDVLDMKPLDKVSDADVWEDSALIELYVNASYNSIYHEFGQDMLSDASDETYCIHNWGNMWVVQKGEMTSDNVTGVSVKVNYWSNAYSNIRSINVFFDRIDDAPVETDLKNRMKGEMKFIRAWIYANLIWRYGDVPLITSLFELNQDYKVTRDSYGDCVDFITKELDEAISLLPAKSSGETLGRATGDACKALKARVLLYAASEQNNPSHSKEKWEAAAEATKAVLDAGYSLGNDYQSVFLEDNDEIIFARYFTQANSTDFMLWNGRNASNGWTGENPTQNLVNAYEMTNGELPYLNEELPLKINPASGYDESNPYAGRDPRLDASILHDGSMWAGRETETWHGGLDSPESSIGSWNASKTAYAFKKFMVESIPPTGSSIKPENPWIFFRLAEFYLNYAEIMYELGNEEQAREYVNKVRGRQSVNMPPVTVSGEKLRDKIRNERRVELAFEGHRFFDVRRWGIADKTENRDLLAMNIQKKEDGSKTYEISLLLKRSFLEQHKLVPIPRTEIDKSEGSLVQNPGY
ncbi:RagB/SusD family nutrient uptake outer membrane protein [Parabacteroides faecis]|uniref:RagB/SusD family nutrient uptake outer membrane protein n=1 Tax=Parabacteroides TaxID=375288 RepID=UPI000EFF7D13|nr:MULTISPECIES: RagB/SusD family nutrient uptake outer membrane protein [Parabacteroides]MBC8620969.1 RagB/SusD family nutrient uptake outer membrane protein [Parabacteroides faecis]RHR96502.1 RagB/SusD family nutrient uptake outer membrane protein [Parabacteroides sp. AF14-59]